MSATSTSDRGSMAPSCARATTSSSTARPTSSTTCARDCLQDWPHDPPVLSAVSVPMIGRLGPDRHAFARCGDAAPVPPGGSAIRRDGGRADRRRRSERLAPRRRPAGQAAVGADVRRDQRSDRRVRQHRRSCSAATPRSPRTSAATSAACTGQPAPRSGFCEDAKGDCAVTHALATGSSRAEITRPDGQIFSVTTFPLAGGSDGASVVQVAKNVTEDIRSARRMQLMSDELALANARSMAAARTSQVDAGAAAPGGEVVGDRAAGRGCRARAEQPAHERDRVRAAAPGRTRSTRSIRLSSGRAELAHDLAAHRRRVGACRAHRPQPARVRAAPGRVARSAGHRGSVRAGAGAPGLRTPPEQCRARARVLPDAALGRRRRQPDSSRRCSTCS